MLFTAIVFQIFNETGGTCCNKIMLTLDVHKPFRKHSTSKKITTSEITRKFILWSATRKFYVFSRCNSRFIYQVVTYGQLQKGWAWFLVASHGWRTLHVVVVLTVKYWRWIVFKSLSKWFYKHLILLQRFSMLRGKTSVSSFVLANALVLPQSACKYCAA